VEAADGDDKADEEDVERRERRVDLQGRGDAPQERRCAAGDEERGEGARGCCRLERPERHLEPVQGPSGRRLQGLGKRIGDSREGTGWGQ